MEIGCVVVIVLSDPVDHARWFALVWLLAFVRSNVDTEKVVGSVNVGWIRRLNNGEGEGEDWDIGLTREEGF